MGDVKDVVFITVVLMLNAVPGFVEEYRADKSRAALRTMSTATARPLAHDRPTPRPRSAHPLH